MEDYIEELRQEILESFTNKKNDWDKNVFKTQQYQQELKYIRNITADFIHALQAISAYSTRCSNIYSKFLTIHSIDDTIQSAIAILTMVNNGIHNTVHRELRYLIEMIVKYTIIDYEKMGHPLTEKLDYLNDNIPNSSIEVIDRYDPPFSVKLNKSFKDEIKDLFYKFCAYVHPSKKQLDEQIKNFNRGNTIGFESPKMLTSVNKQVFRTYDMLLTLMFHTFGLSMSGDLFIQLFYDDHSWKYHKGKYVKEFSKLYDYKVERKIDR